MDTEKGPDKPGYIEGVQKYGKGVKRVPEGCKEAYGDSVQKVREGCTELPKRVYIRGHRYRKSIQKGYKKGML